MEQQQEKRPAQAMVVRPPPPPSGASGMQTVRQGFGEQALEQRNSAATAMAERARAEVQARYIVALQRPRNVEQFRVRLLDHCKRRGFAEKAQYAKPVGKKQVNGQWVDNFVEGASIRFVEAALAEYGNVLPESAIIFEDDTQIIVRVTVTDLERNITHAAEATVKKTVERRSLRKGQQAISSRVNSYGDVVYQVEATDDDVANMKASRESKLLRNQGLRILPPDIVEEAMEQCRATVAQADAKDPAAARRRILDAFHGVGVSPAQVAELLGHPLEQMQPAELGELRQIFQAISEGEATWAAVSAARRPAEAASSDRAAGKEAPAAPAQAPAPAPPAAPARGTAGAKQALKQAKAKQAPAPAPAETPDDLERRVIGLREALEHSFERPEVLPQLRTKIEALPAGDDQDELLELLSRAEVEAQGGEG